MTARVLGGCRCDPATATPIASADGVTLYRTKSRRFFTERGGQLALLTEPEAVAWIREHAGEDVLAKTFDESTPVHLTVDLPAWLVDLLDSRRGRKSRRSVIQAALEKFYQV